MTTTTAMHSTHVSTAALWTGRVLSALAILFMVFDSVVKIIQHPQAVEPTVALGYAATLLVPIGILQLLCLIVYIIPPTSVLGAILLTGYLGGAVATNLRAEMPLFNVIFPALMGIMVWGGLYLRDRPLRALIPLRRTP